MRITNQVLENQLRSLNSVLPIEGKRFTLSCYNGVNRLVLRSIGSGGEESIGYAGTKREVSNTIDAILTVLRIQGRERNR